jgi:hypothetical protein
MMHIYICILYRCVGCCLLEMLTAQETKAFKMASERRRMSGTQFTSFNGTKVQIMVQKALNERRRLACAEFTCFTGTKVQILTLRATCSARLAPPLGGGGGGGSRSGGGGVPRFVPPLASRCGGLFLGGGSRSGWGWVNVDRFRLQTLGS